MEGVLLPEVVLIDERDCLEVLLGELALSRRPLLLLHEVDAEEDAAVAAHHIVKVLAGGNAHVVGIPPHWVAQVVHSMAGFGLTMLGFCIQ